MMMRERARKLAALVLLIAAALPLLSACGRPPLGTAGNPIVLQMVPSTAGPQASAGGEQVAGLLRARTGLEVEVRLAAGHSAIREAMGAGQVQVGLLDTFNYLLAHERYGVDIALVTIRQGASSYRGQIVVRAGSGITTLADLRGRRMCWVSAGSPSGYVVPSVMLAAQGIDPTADFSTAVFSGSDEAVVLAVYRGECDAGATFSDARSSVERQLPDVMEKVTVLATTADILYEGISFAPEVPREARDRVAAALLEVAATDEGRAALAAICSIDGLQAVEDSYYDPFRADLGQAGIDMADLVGESR